MHECVGAHSDLNFKRRGFKKSRRQRRLGVAVIRKLPTPALGRPAVVHIQRRLRLRVRSEVAIASAARVEDVFRSGIRESFGAFDGEMMDAIYTVQDSGSLPETQQMTFLFKRRRSLSLSITPCSSPVSAMHNRTARDPRYQQLLAFQLRRRCLCPFLSLLSPLSVDPRYQQLLAWQLRRLSL